MSDTYTEIFFHVVWTTKRREPMITPAMEAVLYRYLHKRCSDLKTVVHAINGMPDHVHLACTLPPTLAVADLAHKIKGGSALFINHLPVADYSLAWQPGYGALTYARRDWNYVIAYVQNQKRHHSDGTLSAQLERAASESDLARLNDPGLERLG